MPAVSERPRAHMVRQFRVSHQIGRETEIVLKLQDGQETAIETRDAHEAGLILNLLQSGQDVRYDIVAKKFVLDIVEQGGVELLPPSVEQWLNLNHAVRNAIIWQTSSATQAYKDWPQSRKDDLQKAFARAWNLARGVAMKGICCEGRTP